MDTVQITSFSSKISITIVINYSGADVSSLPPLEKGEVARLVKVRLLSIQSSENLSLISPKQIRAVTVGILISSHNILVRSIEGIRHIP